LVLLLAVVHLTVRQDVPQGTLLLVTKEGQTSISLASLPLAAVKGTLTNARGETREISGEGIPLSAVLESTDVNSFSQVTITAEDEFSATVTREEINMPEKVYLVSQGEDSFQLVVFGDADSRRNVTDVIRLEVE